MQGVDPTKNYRTVAVQPTAPCRVLTAARLVEIGIGGGFLATEHPVRVGSPLRLQFQLTAEQEPIAADGEVVATGRHGAGDTSVSGMEVRFTRMELADRLRIIDYVKSSYERQRRFVRLAVRLPVTVHHDEDAFRSQILDLSLGGVFLEAAEPLAVGSLLRLRFRLRPEDDLELKTVGVVRRVFDAQAGHAEGRATQGLGVEFRDLSPEDRVRIRSFLEEQAQEN